MAEVRTPYPLTWPAGWPRARSRKNANFSTRRENGVHAEVSMAVARDRLQEQLDKLGAKEALLSTNIELNLSGQLKGRGAVLNNDPGVAVYFTMKGKPVALACDRWFRVADNIAALAKHIEALRGMDRWGVGTVEQAFTGYAALPAPAGGRHWTKVLGLAADSTLEQIQARYRERVRGLRDHQPELLELNLARDEAVAARSIGGN